VGGERSLGRLRFPPDRQTSVSRELIVTEPADEDIDGYIAYLAARNPDAACRVIVASSRRVRSQVCTRRCVTDLGF